VTVPFAKVNDTFYMIAAESNRGVRDALAANLRRLRIARHLSLSELARATGMSKATLSGIENGQANPTVETLASLSAALRVSFVELLEEAPLAELRIVRASQGRFELRDGVPQRLLDAIGAGGNLELAEIILAARETREVGARGGGSRAHVYVLQGRLIVGPVERISELAPGDYVSFPVDVPHVYEAGRHPARALVLSQSPS
jgi:transcriptional regulator with XRE-family HTH domain